MVTFVGSKVCCFNPNQMLALVFMKVHPFFVFVYKWAVVMVSQLAMIWIVMFTNFLFEVEGHVQLSNLQFSISLPINLQCSTCTIAMLPYQRSRGCTRNAIYFCMSGDGRRLKKKSNAGMDIGAHVHRGKKTHAISL